MGLSANALGATSYTIVDLGDLGGMYGQARAINEQGQIVGESLLPGDGIVQHGFSWQAGTLSDLGTLGGQNSRAVDINSNGTIAGWAQDASGFARPALWEGNRVVGLPTLGGSSGAAWGLNDAGTAVGNAELSAGGFHAALWDAGGVTDLGTLGGSYSVAYDLNDGGRAVGTAYDAVGQERASLWESGSAVDLGDLSGGRWTAARSINEAGEIILWGKPSGVAENHAVFWRGDAGSPVVDLGTFGGSESWAYGLNDQGFVVGWAGKADGTYHAFVWDGAVMTDLGTLGGPFSSAYGINDQGTIVGWAQDQGGVTHAIAWVAVPEPSRVWLLLGGMFALYRSRRRRPGASYLSARLTENQTRRA
ncbi:MAG: PEP-CTERM sorting domain-containing protein [Acidobacteria bacterium]|nr:PEP-CTERM sorting domain-containing protein [Acidobacteriota bacterium]